MSRGGKRSSIFEELSKKAGPCETRFVSTNLLPKNFSKYLSHGTPDIKKYSERESFVGRETEKKPLPDYNPKKEVVLRPIALGCFNFEKQVSRN
jgi:hypothetical protein